MKNNKLNTSIIKMDPTHFKFVAELTFEAFGPNGLGESWTLKSALNFIKHEYNSDYCYVVIKEDKVIGFCLCFDGCFENGKELYLDTLIIKDKHRGQGIGSQLLTFIEKIAKDNGFIGIRLVGNPKLPSFNWYKKNHYQESGWVEIGKKFK